MPGDADDADDLLFSPDVLSPEVFGVFRADPTFEVYGCSSSPITIVQTINRGNLDTSKEPSSVFLWTSAVALSKLWQEVGDGLPSALGRRVLDLSAGLGLNALTAASSGASKVIATEVEPALTSLKNSIGINSHVAGHENISVEELEWGVNTPLSESILAPPLDIVVGADLIYSPSLHEVLLQTLERVLTVGVTTLVLAFEERGSAEQEFLDAARRRLDLQGRFVPGCFEHARLMQVKVFVGMRGQLPPHMDAQEDSGGMRTRGAGGTCRTRHAGGLQPVHEAPAAGASDAQLDRLGEMAPNNRAPTIGVNPVASAVANRSGARTYELSPGTIVQGGADVTQPYYSAIRAGDARLVIVNCARRSGEASVQLFGDVDGGSRILWLPMTEATKEADCRAYLVTHAEGLIANLRDGFTVVVSCQEGLHRSVEFTRQLLTLCAIPHLASEQE